MKQGIPVVMVDRKVTSRENYITFVTASDTAVGRIEAHGCANT
jgi:ribose transport system substrate-binding protein